MREMVVTSSVLILLLILLRRVLRGRISPRVQYALWLLAAARLLIPGTLFTAPVTLIGAAEEIRSSVQEVLPDLSRVPVSAPPAGAEGTALWPDDGTEKILASGAAASPWELMDWRGLVWKAGMSVTGGALALSNLLFYLRLRRSRRRLERDRWSGGLRVYEAEGLASPCLFGLPRPAVYLNEAAMGAEHPEHILAHEYAHYRHGDHIWTALRCACVAVHWYNPLVWWAAALSRRDCELACDEAAVRRLGEAERIDYGQTLLAMASQARDPAALLRAATTMTAGKRAMGERIAALVRRPRMRKMTAAAVAALACLLAACAFGGAAPAQTEPSGGEAPAAVFLGEALSSQFRPGAVTDPEIVSELWELYRSFAFDGAADGLSRDNAWSVTVTFQDGEGAAMAHFTIFAGGLCWLGDDYETLHVLREGQRAYEAFRDACRTAPRDETVKLGPAGGEPAAALVSQVFSSQTADSSYITDPEEIACLWEQYRSFAFTAAAAPGKAGGWPVTVSFYDGQGETLDFYMLTEDGTFVQSGEYRQLRNGREIYEELLRLSGDAAYPFGPAADAGGDAPAV